MGSSSQRPGHTSPGGRGAAAPQRPSLSTDHRLGRTPRPPTLVCLGRKGLLPPARFSSAPTKELKEGLRGIAVPKRPGHTSLGGWGVLPRRWSVLKEGLPGATAPYGLGIPAWGDGESCPGGGQCSGWACGG